MTPNAPGYAALFAEKLCLSAGGRTDLRLCRRRSQLRKAAAKPRRSAVVRPVKQSFTANRAAKLPRIFPANPDLGLSAVATPPKAARRCGWKDKERKPAKAGFLVLGWMGTTALQGVAMLMKVSADLVGREAGYVFALRANVGGTPTAPVGALGSGRLPRLRAFSFVDVAGGAVEFGGEEGWGAARFRDRAARCGRGDGAGRKCSQVIRRGESNGRWPIERCVRPVCGRRCRRSGSGCRRRCGPRPLRHGRR